MDTILGNKATRTTKRMTAGKCGRRDVERLVSEMPPGWEWMPFPQIRTISQASTSEPQSLAELAQNSFDALSRLGAYRHAADRGLPVDGDAFDGMYTSPRDAAEKQCGIPQDGRLSAYKAKTGHSLRWLASRTASLIVERGSGNMKARPTIKMVDWGIGVSSHLFDDTFLNVAVGDKFRRTWEHGRHGNGGFAAAKHCDYYITLSKRAGVGGEAEGVWGIIIVRRQVKDSPAGKYEDYDVLAYPGADGRKVFPTLPADARLYVNETICLLHRSHNVGDDYLRCEAESQASKYTRSRGAPAVAGGPMTDDSDDLPDPNATEVVYEVLKPAGPKPGKRVRPSPEERGVVTRIRYVARRPIPHGTMKILVDTCFDGAWVRQPVGVNNGIYEEMKDAIPSPLRPFMVVDNRFADGEASIETGERVSLAMAGRTPEGEPIPIEVPIELGGEDAGTVDVTMYYSSGSFSDRSKWLVALPRIFLAGQTIAAGTEWQFNRLLGTTAHKSQFACSVEIDRLNPKGLRAVCSSGRTVDSNDKTIAKIMNQIIAAVGKNPRMKVILGELNKSLETTDEMAMQISRVLSGKGNSTFFLSLNGRERVPACVKGADMPKTIRPDYVWFDSKPKFKGKNRTFETLNPLRVSKGSVLKLRVATSCGCIDFSRKGGEYRLVTEILGPKRGISVDSSKNTVKVSVGSDAREDAKSPTTIIVYVVGDGFTSVPGVVKIMPRKPKPEMVLLPEPTFIKINGGFGSGKLPVDKAEEIGFTSDAEESFRRFKASVRHGGPGGRVVTATTIKSLGAGKWKASIPAIKGAKPGDACLFSVASDGTSVSVTDSKSLVVVESKKRFGGKGGGVWTPSSEADAGGIIDMPGERDGGLRIILAKDTDSLWSCPLEAHGKVTLGGGEEIGVVNLMSPDFIKSKEITDEEIRKEKDPERRTFLKSLEISYINVMSLALNNFAETHDLKGGDRDHESDSVEHMRTVALSHPFMTEFDPAAGRHKKRYDRARPI